MSCAPERAGPGLKKGRCSCRAALSKGSWTGGAGLGEPDEVGLRPGELRERAEPGLFEVRFAGAGALMGGPGPLVLRRGELRELWHVVWWPTLFPYPEPSALEQPELSAHCSGVCCNPYDGGGRDTHPTPALAASVRGLGPPQ